MIINHNLAANNAIRSANSNATTASKSMQKLSSGLRINSAADDAAGLAISEKMRGQIRGLDQASSNAQDAISLTQTAEGALNETQSILQRMRELSVQSATDTNTADDRTKIQGEVDQLAKEITRISNTSEFNTKNLLAGGLDSTFQIGANKDQNLQLTISAMDAKSLGVAGNEVTTTLNAATKAETGVSTISTSSEGVNGTFIIAKKTAAASGTASQGTLAGTLADDSSLYTGSSDKTFTVKVNAVDGSNEVTNLSYSTDGGSTWTSATNTAAGKFTLAEGVKIDIGADAGNIVGAQASIAFTAEKITFALTSTDGTAGGSLIGAEVDVHNNQSSVTIGDAATNRQVTLGFNFATVQGTVGTAYGTSNSTQIDQNITASTVATLGSDGSVTVEADTKKGINVSTQSAANTAIETIDKAINTVSTERSKLGAYQNRLEHTIANLGTSSENLTSAESRIRDVDMAKEMSTFSKNNILSQAAQAMLAQANSQPQQVLQLLR